MHILYILYTLLTSVLFILLVPPFWLYSRITGRYAEYFMERLGFIPPEMGKIPLGSPRIWIHAVSLGEVKVAASIIHALKHILPDCSLIVSTTTESGRNLAQETFNGQIPVIYAPVDFVGSVRWSLATVKPHIMVFLETEIWPLWAWQSHRMGIKNVLINGRISLKSVSKYFKLRLFFREVLKNFDAFSMIMQGDAVRIESMGADPRKIQVNGNAKYDLLEKNVVPAVKTEMRRVLNLDQDDKVFVAGSTRHGEEEKILDAYKKILREFPGTILLLAPRHIERTPEIVSIIKKCGLGYQLRTDLNDHEERRTKQIMIINTFGELFNMYSIGTIVFSGGSLVPLGGQNPLEPAIWGKVVLYGPHMENFLDAKAILESANAGVTVHDSDELADRVNWFLSHSDEMLRVGERAREAVLTHKGAAEKHARVIARLLN